MNNRKIVRRNLEIQLFTLVFSLISTIISMILTYNEKLNIEKRKKILEKKEDNNLSLFNRILILLISVSFLYVNYKSFKIAKKRGQNAYKLKLQIIASLLTVIASLISLYVILKSRQENIASIENPIV